MEYDMTKEDEKWLEVVSLEAGIKSLLAKVDKDPLAYYDLRSSLKHIESCAVGINAAIWRAE